MSEETAAPASVPDPPSKEKGVVLISYPNVVFLWPAWVISIIASIFMYFWEVPPDSIAAIRITWLFVIVLSINLLVLAFDFPRATSFMLFFALLAIFLGGMLAVRSFPDFLPAISKYLNSLHPEANCTFYFLFAVVMTFIYIGVAITSRFDYWEVRPNELLHHHGVLSDLERFSSPHLRVNKEINDLFEYMLLGSGRLILLPDKSMRPVVLENVFFITSKEKAITKLLGALQVQVREQ